jgi:hypothetical protein
MTRPLMQKTAKELEEAFLAAGDDTRELNRLLKELGHRRVPSARLLRTRVEDRLSKLVEAVPKQDGTINESAHSNSAAEHQIISCQVCSQKLRIPARPTVASYHCPGCRASFSATFDGRVCSLLFKASRDDEAQQARPITVEDAYALFGANPLTPWEIIETERRRLIQQYHPDKVAALGLKLRALAELEAKRINTAYDLLRRSRSS